MPPLPKRKFSQGRRNRRRSQDHLIAPKLVSCPQCHKMYRPHHVCPSCGYYDGKKVIEVKEKKKKGK